MALSETSIEPSQCPFWGTEIASPGAGFMRHVENEPECRDDGSTRGATASPTTCGAAGRGDGDAGARRVVWR